MIAIGFVPAGSLFDGALAALVGLHEMFAIAGALCALTFLVIWFTVTGRSKPYR